MKKHKMSFNVSVMSKVLKVDRASYYHWVKMGCVIEKVDEQLNRFIKSIFEEGRRLYGTRYVGDITYISTKQGWLYLATVIDLYTTTIEKQKAIE